MKKNRVLIIEDEPSHYQILRKTLEQKEFDVYPKVDNIDNYKQEFYNDLLRAMDGDIEEYMYALLQSTRPNAVICDIHLGENYPSKGVEICNTCLLMRDRLYNNEETLFPSIHLITSFSTESEGKKLIKYGAEYHIKFFNGKEVFDENRKTIFIERLKFGILNLNKEKRLLENVLKPAMSNYVELLERNNQIVVEKIQDVKLLIKGNHTETMQTLGVLFYTSFQGLSQSQQKKVQQNFEEEIKKILNDKVDLIGKTRWEEFKNVLGEIREKGGIEKFADTTIEMLEEVGVFDFTGGKIISIGLKGIIGIACS